MIEEEGQAIYNYKEYSLRHFGPIKHLYELYIKHYDGDPRDLDHLDRYLVTIRKMSRKLRRAADLRQYHYDRFIVTEEEPGHAHWRIGLNQIAQDAEDKVKYWEDQREVAWDQLSLVYDLPIVAQRIKNPDDYTNVIVVKQSKIIRPPSMSKKMRKALQKAQQEADNQTLDALLSNIVQSKDKIIQIIQSCKIVCTHSHTFDEFIARKDEFEYWNLYFFSSGKIRFSCKNEMFNMCSHLIESFITTKNFNYLMYFTLIIYRDEVVSKEEKTWIFACIFGLIERINNNDMMSNVFGSIFAYDYEHDGKKLIQFLEERYQKSGKRVCLSILSCTMIGKYYKACLYLNNMLHVISKRTTLENTQYIFKHSKMLHWALNLNTVKRIGRYVQTKPDVKFLKYYKDLCNQVRKKL